MSAPCFVLTPAEKRVYQKAAVILHNSGATDYVNFRRAILEQFGDTVKPFTKEIYLGLKRSGKIDKKKLDSPELIEQIHLNAEFEQLSITNGLSDEQMDMLKRMFNAVGASEKAIDPKFIDKLVEYATAIKLTGIGTQVKNIIGNTGMLMLRVPEKTASGMVDKAKSAFLGIDRTVRSREALSEFMGITMGMRRASKEAMDVLVHPNKYLQTTTKAGDVLTRTGSIGRGGKTGEKANEILRKATKGKVGFNAGEVIRTPFRLLAMMDVFFKELNRSAEVYAQVTRASLNSGKFGGDLIKDLNKINKVSGDVLLNPDQFKTLNSIAEESALIRVFQEDLTGVAKNLQGLTIQHPVTKLIVPFFKTPVNLFKQALRRTPGLGFALPSVYKPLFKDGMKASLQDPRFVEFLGQQVAGAAMFTAIGFMVADEKLIGDGSKNMARKTTLMATGEQPNTVQVPGTDVWVSYRGFEPFSSWMTTIANAYEKTEDKEAIQTMATNLLLSYGKQFADNPFMTGINSLNEALNASRGRDASETAANFIGALAVSSTIPTLIQQWGRVVFDPVLRRSKDPIKGVKARIPGLSKSVEPVRDVFGDPVTREFRGIPKALGFDIYMRKNDKLSKAMRELKGKDGKPFSVGKPSRTIKGIRLSDEQFDRYLYLTGAMYKESFNKYVNSAQYRTDDDEQRYKTMNKIKTIINKLVREDEFKMYYEEDEKAKRRQRRPKRKRNNSNNVDKFIGKVKK